MPPDKDKALFEAALSEFAEKGFARASTNEIARRAGISKGLAFHYYGSKKGLFLGVLDRSIAHLIKRFAELSPEREILDPFERIMERSVVKMRLSFEEPAMYKLIYDAFVAMPPELAPDLGRRYQAMVESGMAMMGSGVDPSLLREGVDPAKAMNLVMIFLEGWTNRYTEDFRRSGAGYEEVFSRVEELKAEALEYFDMIKRGIYKDP
jgi:AcrR family transcriptional regulator